MSNMSYMLEFLSKPPWIFGGRMIFWLQNIKSVEDFIRSHGLNRAPTEHMLSQSMFLGPVMIGAEVEKKSPTTIPNPIPYPGGIRVAHLHYKGDVYLLTPEQWKEFSAGIIKGFQEKLAKVSSIGFEQIMEISEAIGGLG